MLGKAVFKGMLSGALAGGELDVLVIAQSRTTISLLLLAPTLLLIYGRGIFAIPLRALWRCLLMGAVGISGANFFYYYAIDRTNVATAIVVQYTAPVWVLLYLLAAGKERPSRRRFGTVALAVIGIALCLEVINLTTQSPFLHFPGLNLDARGVAAAFGAAFAFAFYNLIGGTVLKTTHRWTVYVYALLGSTTLWLVVNPPWKIVAAHYSGEQWLFLSGFAVFSMLLPFGLYLAGLQYLDVTRAIVVACLEPVFAILLAATIVHEPVHIIQIVGMTIVLAATVLIQSPGAARAS